jgi:flagellar basal-body rod modification protein FlgD
MSAGAIGGTRSGGTPVASNPYANLSSAEFIDVMLSELSHQDPLNPQDSTKLLEQLSSLRNIESQLKLQEQLESLVLQNQITAASAMIGKLVAGLDQGNEMIQGLVTSVRVEDGKASLELDSGKTLAIERIARVLEPPAQ